VVNIAGKDLMAAAKLYFIYPGYAFVAYQNRDSTPFKERDNIPEVQTVVRGTLRYQGFPEVVKVLSDMGFLSEEVHGFLKESITWKEATQKNLAASSSTEKDFEWAIASKTKFNTAEDKYRILSGFK